MAQGKEWDKEKVIKALEPYFKLGYSVNKACSLARIPQSTISTWMLKDDELRLKIDAWRGSVGAKAREVLAKDIVDGKDITSAKWYLERIEREDFSTRVEQDVDTTIKSDDLKETSKLLDRLIEREDENSEQVQENNPEGTQDSSGDN